MRSRIATLLNAPRPPDLTPLRPLVLPYASLDFDDPIRALQAVETAGCAVLYPDDSTLCAAVGSNLYWSPSFAHTCATGTYLSGTLKVTLTDLLKVKDLGWYTSGEFGHYCLGGRTLTMRLQRKEEATGIRSGA